MEKYRKLRVIGQGQFGDVLLVRKRDEEGRLYALKAILNHGKAIGRSEKDRNDARGEVHLLSGLKHPNIVQYQGSFFHEGTFHIVMEYCQGGDLAERIKRRKSKPFSERQIMDWFVQLCMAVDSGSLTQSLKTRHFSR